MTAAGVATLYISQDYLLQAQQATWGRCAGGVPNPNITAGLAWLDKHINELLGGNLYGMYGVERIGVASGRKNFGPVDWYQNGSEYLVRHQAKDGHWDSSYKAVPSTVFATLFLVRGRAPVVMNKLEYELSDAKLKKQAEPWNERPRDVANLTHWLGKQSERFYNWQVVNLKIAPDDLHDAPILFISGAENMDFSQKEIDKLREFAIDGGIILANADCGSDRFERAWTGPNGLAHKLFPRYEFRELPPEHPIYTNQNFRAKNWKNKPKVMGISNGVREMLLLVPEADVSRAWQTNSVRTREEAYQLAADLFYYAVDKENEQFRGETYIVKPDPKAPAGRKVTVARLLVGDNPDPEPAGWPRLANIMRNQYGVALSIDSVKLGEGKLKGKNAPQIAHLTGTTRFKLSDTRRKEVKEYVEGNGTLIVDAAGGSTDFADSAEKELAAMFGGEPANFGSILGEGDEVWKVQNLPEANITNVQFRPYAKLKIAGKLNVPRVRAVGRRRAEPRLLQSGRPLGGIGRPGRGRDHRVSAGVCGEDHAKPDLFGLAAPGEAPDQTGVPARRGKRSAQDVRRVARSI